MAPDIPRDPVTAMLSVWPKPPGGSAPVKERLAWLERLAVMHDQIAYLGGSNGLSASGAVFAADLARRDAKHLREQLTPRDADKG